MKRWSLGPHTVFNNQGCYLQKYMPKERYIVFSAAQESIITATWTINVWKKVLSKVHDDMRHLEVDLQWQRSLMPS